MSQINYVSCVWTHVHFIDTVPPYPFTTSQLIIPLTHEFSLQCLYCEGTFRDHTILKEHMRKKLHKRINPKNKTYDKFYVINYLEFGKSWEEVQSEDDREIINQDDK